ncbi:MAG: TIGR02300 family protein [Pseudomonadota bacterium]
MALQSETFGTENLISLLMGRDVSGKTAVWQGLYHAFRPAPTQLRFDRLCPKYYGAALSRWRPIVRTPHSPQTASVSLFDLGPRNRQTRPNVAQPGAGTKRVCPETGKKFYDLGKDPIVSPYTGNEYPLSFFEEAAATRGATRKKDVKDDETADTAEGAKADDEDEDEDDASPAFVSLEDADDNDDDDTDGIPDIDGDEDDEPTDDADDNTFLETDDDENDDLSDVVKASDDDD